MSAIIDLTKSALDEWNNECQRTGHKFRFEIKADLRMKKHYINKNDFVEQEIAELLFLHVKTDPSEKDFLLYRKEIFPYTKQKHEKDEDRKRKYVDSLYRHLMYEMLGAFAILTKQSILNDDYAEYDIENDRLKQHESADGMVIKTLVGGPFFEASNEFDVFMDTEGDYYAVYTAHEYGRKNNGIARIPKKDCLVTQAAKKKIILL